MNYPAACGGVVHFYVNFVPFVVTLSGLLFRLRLCRAGSFVVQIEFCELLLK